MERRAKHLCGPLVADQSRSSSPRAWYASGVTRRPAEPWWKLGYGLAWLATCSIALIGAALVLHNLVSWVATSGWRLGGLVLGFGVPTWLAGLVYGFLAVSALGAGVRAWTLERQRWRRLAGFAALLALVLALPGWMAWQGFLPGPTG